MVARILFALGVGLIAATTWAAEPLRFVTEPESAAIPLPDEAANALPIAQEDAAELAPVPSLPSSRRLRSNPPPAPQATDDPAVVVEEPAAEPEVPPPARVLPSTRKTKVITVVRPKPFSADSTGPRTFENHSAKPIEQSASPPMPMGKLTPTPRHLAPPAVASRPHATPPAPGSSTGQPHLAPRKAARIAVSPDEKTAGNFAKPTPVKTRHLLPPVSEASQPAAGDSASTPEPELLAEKPTTGRRRPAAQEESESMPLAATSRKPAPLADGLAMATPRPAVPAEDESTQAGAAFRFRLSDDGASSAARNASANDGASLETGSTATLNAGPGLEFRSAEAPPAARRTLAGSDALEPASNEPPPVLHRVPLALRLDSLHPKSAKTPRPRSDEIASLDAGALAEAPQGGMQPAATPSENQETTLAQATQPAAPPVKGSVVNFDRSRQTVRLLFRGTEPPPVGSMIRLQHIDYFGASEFTTLRVVRVDRGEVLARATSNSRLPRISRGDLAFYRPLPTAEGSKRAANVARAPVTARETVWK